MINICKFFKWIFAERKWSKLFWVLGLIGSAVYFWFNISGVVTGGIVFGLFLYLLTDDFGGEAGGSTAFAVVVMLVAFLGGGMINEYEVDEKSTVDIKVAEYEIVTSTEKIVVTLDTEFKQKIIVISGLDDTQFYEVRKKDGKTMTAELIRTFYHDHQDKVFWDSEPTSSIITIQFTIDGIELPAKSYDAECEDFRCVEVFEPDNHLSMLPPL